MRSDHTKQMLMALARVLRPVARALLPTLGRAEASETHIGAVLQWHAGSKCGRAQIHVPARLPARRARVPAPPHWPISRTGPKILDGEAEHFEKFGRHVAKAAFGEIGRIGRD